MLKPLKDKRPLFIASGVLLFSVSSMILLTPKVVEFMEQQQQVKIEAALKEDPSKPSVVLTLAELPPEQRDQKLQEIAASETLSLERSRARYLLANDLLAKYEGGPALRQLEGLEDEYPTLVPYILLKRGRGYELTNEPEKAQETWKQLVETYADSLASAEALYKLGKFDPLYWDQGIEKFPQHPKIQEIIRQRLKENPKQPKLLLLLAQYVPNEIETNTIRDRLIKDYSSQLTAENWQFIADGYWATNEYNKAAQAYQKAPKTPQNFYRIARGQQLQPKGNNKEAVIAAYRQVMFGFPNSPEAAMALQRLAKLSPSETAISYLNQIIQKFPEQAPEALVNKAELLDKLNRKAEAAKVRQDLLSKYPNAEATADYRWQVAQRAAAKGDLVKAWTWAQPISTNSPDSSVAPKAAFWVGKWAQQLGRGQDAKSAFEHVVASHPQSYYAWRSAVQLGWDVGNFNDVRQVLPTVNKPNVRSIPPAGSEMFQELYRLGEDQDAITLFKAEMGDRQELTVNESFTDALLKLVQGKNLQGINQVWNLKHKDEPEQEKEWQQLRQTSEYWHALFPFPFYQTIMKWSQDRKLNPLLVTSLMRQESRFEPEIKSPVGATGLMQVMPATGEWVANKINLKKYSLKNPNDNVNLGTWYLNYTHEEYQNNSLLAVASYNAGPGNVAKWMRQYKVSDPDAFVEKIPFKETRGYVESVFGNYWNYLRIYNPEIAQLLAQYGHQNLTK
ncbi:transglycosylase SLT domain-containing protein [Crocosphaera sp. UHCC 0190]|uniref:lytic transglycosylase domain-containing protein n=1 Tax=Crocosphaera sp. UHCC 0190 TaxID=3110246 RepID=UPI002B1ED6AB|nr:transglycosylase SLT domain-containing protein [Crocosphaera sp. UHCC 0190]MEA5508575.1 transglycosylase SLT domain-containing protein [Crocosphaera sp. UHCC 0190]